MILHVDPFAGVAGDMFLGALLDAGWAADELLRLPERLGLAARVRVDVDRVMRGPLAATYVQVVSLESEPPHRHLPEIRAMIEQGELPATVAARSIQVFEALACAEAQVHGTTMEAVHFHEVGALDAIIDIVGVCLALTDLGVTEVTSGPLPVGDGWVQTDHGPLPVPAPATAALIASAMAPTTTGPQNASGELVTPTGAALVTVLARFDRPGMFLERIGYGAGTRAPTTHPNVLRVMLGRPLVEQTGDVVVLETHLDDVSAEVLADACDALRELGALDVSVGAIQMKKGRVGSRLTVVCDPAAEAEMVAAVLERTPSLGIRARAERRHVVPRTTAEVATRFGAQPVKLRRAPSGRVDAAPEYDACRRAAAAHGVTVAEVYSEVISSARHAMDLGVLAWPVSGSPWPDLLRRTVRDLARRPGYSWTGIYLVDGDLLRLGPYVGHPTEHVSIPVGTGICGAAAAERATIVVDDVTSDPRYLACFASTRSEIVVPIYAAGDPALQVIGEIDVDSDQTTAFDASDRLNLEQVAEHLGRLAPSDVFAGVVHAEAVTA